VFDGLQYNDKRSDRNQSFPFINTDSQNRTLPSLDLERVFILSSGRTCSASESIINGLRGIDVEVILIGAATCGKPYGFLPADNCGTTYFSIQFKSVNDKGFGDFADGFVPVVGGGTEPWEVPGCLVADDFDHLLGDPDEARLAAALGYMQTGTCPASSADSLASLAIDGDIRQPRTARTILRQNRWYDGYREAVVRQERRRAAEVR
ncbi:MAG: peptidase, partial [Gammaproteobacteria bacterium]|nr:peptidase [Gammaproteobacteria bacterium]